jgi:hypothetical protein
MSHIELPRSVVDYFAYAELASTDRGRHFTITFTYLEGAKLDRLQWWWQLSKQQDRSGEAQQCREVAISRFIQHIERWLFNSQRRLTGGLPFPLLGPCVEAAEQTVAASASAAEAAEAEAAEAAYVDAVRGFARIAAGS